MSCLSAPVRGDTSNHLKLGVVCGVSCWYVLIQRRDCEDVSREGAVPHRGEEVIGWKDTMESRKDVKRVALVRECMQIVWILKMEHALRTPWDGSEDGCIPQDVYE
jgi:hypothetical protein